MLDGERTRKKKYRSEDGREDERVGRRRDGGRDKEGVGG